MVEDGVGAETPSASTASFALATSGVWTGAIHDKQTAPAAAVASAATNKSVHDFMLLPLRPAGVERHQAATRSRRLRSTEEW